MVAVYDELSIKSHGQNLFPGESLRSLCSIRLENGLPALNHTDNNPTTPAARCVMGTLAQPKSVALVIDD